MAIPVDQETEVLALHAQGHARNEIARRVGISAGSATNICRDQSRTEGASREPSLGRRPDQRRGNGDPHGACELA